MASTTTETVDVFQVLSDHIERAREEVDAAQSETPTTATEHDDIAQRLRRHEARLETLSGVWAALTGVAPTRRDTARQDSDVSDDEATFTDANGDRLHLLRADDESRVVLESGDEDYRAWTFPRTEVARLGRLLTAWAESDE